MTKWVRAFMAWRLRRVEKELADVRLDGAALDDEIYDAERERDDFVRLKGELDRGRLPVS